MPITATAVTNAIRGAGPTLTGPTWLKLSSAVGIAVVQWSSSRLNVALTGSGGGVMGAGTVTGTLTIIPNAVPVTGSLASAGFKGLSASKIGAAVGIGIGTAYTASAMYSGQSAGWGVGADVSKVTTAISATLTPLLVAAMAGQGLAGPQASLLAAGLSPGISTLFLTGFGTGAATGGGGPMAGTGTSTSGVV